MLNKRQKIALTIVEIILLVAVMILTTIVLYSNSDKDNNLVSDNSPNIIPPISDYEFYGDNEITDYEIEEIC